MRIEDAKRRVHEKFRAGAERARRRFRHHRLGGYGPLRSSVRCLRTARRNPRSRWASPQAVSPVPCSRPPIFSPVPAIANSAHGILRRRVGAVAILRSGRVWFSNFSRARPIRSTEVKVQTVLPKRDASLVRGLQGSVKKLEEKNQCLTAIENDADFDACR